MSFKNGIYRTELYEYVRDAAPESVTQKGLIDHLKQKGIFDKIEFEFQRYKEAVNNVLVIQEDDGEIYPSTATGKDAGARMHDYISALHFVGMLNRFGFVHYGSARPKSGDADYQHSYEISKSVAQIGNGLIVNVNGGGPGVMEATTKGALDGGAKSNGLPIALPFEPDENEFLSRVYMHNCFGTRLEDFNDRANATYVDKGGFGSLYELGDILQKRQVKHVPDDFVIVADPTWKPPLDMIIQIMHDQRVENKQTPFISPKDKDLITRYTDSVDEITDEIRKAFDGWKKNIYMKFKKSAR